VIHFPLLPEGTNVIGVGIDQIEVARIRESMDRHGEAFLSKVFTPKEKSFCLDRNDPAPCLAARFAAKEAASKALGTGIGKEFGWLDLEVEKGENGQPFAVFSDQVQPFLDQKNAGSALLSLSHLDGIASAIVVLIR
jgi:holo-[acyl-carrier protein] synthase